MYFYPRPPIQYYNSRATTVDFRNPSVANIQQVLKESWPLLGLVGAASIVMGMTKLVPWSSPELSYIIGGTLLAGAGYGYLNKDK